MKCPRSLLRTSLCARFCVIRSCQNSWWKCRRSYPILSCCFCCKRFWSTSSGLWSRTLTFQLLVVGGAGGGLSGFLPGQNNSMTAEQIVDNPVLWPGGAGDLQGFPRGQGSTAFSEQIAEFRRSRFSASPGLRSVFLGSSWTSWSRGFSHFSPPQKKGRRSRAPRGRNLVPSRAHGRRELSWELPGLLPWFTLLPSGL